MTMLGVLLLGAMTLTNCRKKDEVVVPPTQEETLKEFTLKTSTVTVAKGGKIQIEITSGNGEYQTNSSAEARKVVQITFSADKKMVEIVGISLGKVKTSIVDVKSNKNIELNIDVVAKQYEIEGTILTKWVSSERNIDMTQIPALSKITEIGEGAFLENKTLENVILPSSLTKIGSDAFADCESLASVIISEGVKTIDRGAFGGCKNLKTIALPSTLEVIDQNAFEGTGLETIRIPNATKSIGLQAFSNCAALTAVHIGTGVTSIENSAFSQNPNLKSVVIDATTPPVLPKNAFDGAHKDLKIYVPKEVVDAYKKQEGWDLIADKIVAKS